MSARLLKKDTVALWHAVGWMQTVLNEWRKDEPDAKDDPAYLKQKQLLLDAKRALRKVNELRKQGL